MAIIHALTDMPHHIHLSITVPAWDREVAKLLTTMVTTPDKRLSPRDVYKGRHSTLSLQLTMRTLMASKSISLRLVGDMAEATTPVHLLE